MKIPHNIKEQLIEFIRDPRYHPLKDHELADELGIASHHRPSFRSLLKDLANEGQLSKIRGNRWALSKERLDRLAGTISVSPQGHGMVRITGKTGSDAEIFIPPNALGSALHGDLVEVEKLRINERQRRKGAEADLGSRFRPEGRVIRIVERRKRIIVGVYMKSATHPYVVPDHPRINQNVFISGVDRSLTQRPTAGHKVVVRLNEELHGDMLAGEIIENLGDPNAPGVDVLAILREHEISTGFRPDTEKEARSRKKELSKDDMTGRLDLRKECIITIDPSDAKDHDDAVSLRRNPDGSWTLGVHIADVSHFVTPGSSIDKDAREHGNSVYMVDRFIPMLPPYLTSEICSLKAGGDRLAYSVFITYSADADVTKVEMKSSVIHPEILLDYDQVQKLIISGNSSDIPHQYHGNLRQMHELSSMLRKKRMRHGAIDLTMPEISCKLDDTGRPVSLKRRSSPEAYHLIEEFMLAANVAVAERLDESHVPAIYRVHDEPSEDQWQQMAMDLQQLGIQAAPADRHDVQLITREYQNQPLSYPVSISILRNFKRAIYSPDCTQHFGLSFPKYTHFTSPIRRYSDLIVHRILKSLDQVRGGFYSKKECDEVAAHCSRREREASEAEEESLIIKRIQFYEQLLQDGDIGPWPALITGGTARGLLVEIVETLQRGFIPTYALPDPNLDYDRKTGFMLGHRGKKLARIGTTIPVELIRVDKNRRSVELRWAVEGGQRKQQPSKRRQKDKVPVTGKRRHRKR